MFRTDTLDLTHLSEDAYLAFQYQLESTAPDGYVAADSGAESAELEPPF